MTKRFERKSPTHRQIYTVINDPLYYLVVVLRLYDHQNIRMVFRCGAHHGRATDIDVFYGQFVRAVRTLNRGSKGV